MTQPMSDSVYKIPLKVHEARYSRDTLSKAIYARCVKPPSSLENMMKS